MNKKIYFTLIFIMSIALIGIILVQAFWIKTTLDNKEEQFSLNINQALKSVSEQIQSRELRDYLAVYQKLVDSIGSPKESQLTAVFKYVDRNENTNQTYIYSHGILEEDYNISAKFFEPDVNDSTSILEYKSLKTTTIIDDAFDEEMQSMSSIERLQRVERLSLMDKAKYESVFMELASLKPIHRRLSNVELELLLQLSGAKQPSKNLSFDELIKCYLKADHNWSKRTKELNEYVFRSYQSGKSLPPNPTTRAIFVRTINTCWNWGMQQGLITKADKREGDTHGE